MADPATVIDISSSAPPSQKPPTSTLSAVDALASLNGGAKSAISSGIDSLNHVLIGTTSANNGGYERGKVAELWGPSGSGKTALAGTRLKALSDNTKDQSDSSQRMLNNLQHISVRTLSHLLALILHPPPSFPPQGTALLVVDDVQTLIDLDYPRMPFGKGSRNEQQKWQASRRYAILGSLVTALGKLAVLHDMAIIVTTGCASRPRNDSGLGAALGPGVGGSEWEGGIWSRTVLFRDFNGRFSGVQKCNGRNLTPLDPVGDIRNVAGFEISADGWLKEQVIDLTSSSPVTEHRPPSKAASSPAKAVRKRNYEEIADSDDDGDEYGWAETDEDVLAGGPTADEVRVLAEEDKATKEA
ncbi:hypothetical protein PRZ48_010179 [Zasmidium cellare]|uniref:Uncharacterized protein n=1 Tax=Zasmidium cellare TaxID=395010 RepID=A0ABR0EEF4_ZASCE|nr:hypothetical protein PRZ48_010179 [Zasmidium cellare]